MNNIHLEKPQILIYQMGKVASKSIENSLKKQTSFKNIIHVHHLSKNELKQIENRYNNELKLATPEYILWGFELNKAIKENIGHIPFKIITLYRDPIEVEISAVFQNIEINSRNCFKNDGSINLDKLLAKIENGFNNYNPDKNYFINWFDKELLDVFHFNIYNIDPSILAKHGYYIHKENNIEILVMNFHRLSEIFQKAINDFLNISGIELLKSNISAEKKYAKEYEEFKKRLTISNSAKEKVYSTKYAKFFNFNSY